jgi:hypothetical protein
MSLPSKEVAVIKDPFMHYILAYFLEAITVQPRKRPLLAKGSETDTSITYVARQRIRNNQK